LPRRRSNNPVEDDFEQFADMMEADFARTEKDMAGMIPMGHKSMSQEKQVQLADMMQQKPELRRHFVELHGEKEVARMEETMNRLRISRGYVK
jgi:hypothetical protein